jgi:serine/threonine protein kinase/serine/threonine protein phosphatase PrpC
MNLSSPHLTIGQSSFAGLKSINQDFCHFHLPNDHSLSLKGAVVAMADGISSSDVSQEASQTAVNGFIADYYSTPDVWSVKTSAHRVLSAMNSWLFAQTKQSEYRYDIDRGYVCTFSAIIFKSATAHIFHVGDTRVYRRHQHRLEQLTQDHRRYVTHESHVTHNDSYLSRAMGADSQLDIDYSTYPIEIGDQFVIATDGIYEHLSDEAICHCIDEYEHDLDLVARKLVSMALDNGSNDNLTIQIIRVENLPDISCSEALYQSIYLPFSPPLDPPCHFDGYDIVREIHANHRSHVYLAKDPRSGVGFVLKLPSIDQKGDQRFIEQFVREEWVAKRINSPHVCKVHNTSEDRHYLYTAMEFIEGENLTQWLRDNPIPSLSQVRNIVLQVAKGLTSFHRLEMVHQDIRPENILIDSLGTVKLIDFGATYISGLEGDGRSEDIHLLGTAMYSAPECFLGHPATWQSDQFSLAVLTYYLLSGEFPYGTDVAKARTRSAQYKLSYRPLAINDRALPIWLNEPLKRALSIEPYTRFEALSEFIMALNQPSERYLARKQLPLMERNPAKFWQMLSLLLFILLMVVILSE